jgi:hypothetical protein
MKMQIKRLCLANGDEYENVSVTLNKDEFKKAISAGEVILIEAKSKEILLNSEFIVSAEVRESRKLSAI